MCNVSIKGSISRFSNFLNHPCQCWSCTLFPYYSIFNSSRKLFGCLQAPFLEMRNMIKPPPSPIHGEGESLSEWFCHMDGTPQSDCSSLSVPFAELSISYMDDVSDTSSYGRDDEKDDQERLSRGNCSSFRSKLFLPTCFFT